MKIDLLHNKIIKDSVSAGFVESFMENIVLVLEEKYGDSVIEAQMYEDYLNDGFVRDGFFYYPLTLVFEDGCKREWIRWSVSEKRRFTGGVPYAYTGKDPLSFEIAASVPSEFEEKLSGRGIYFENSFVPFNIETASDSPTFLVGKYSQSFIDEMNRQISRAIEKEFSIEGIADSTVELTLIFVPGTFMEHASGGVTYRRLLITAKGCAPRDLWIKWYSKCGDASLSVSDNASADTVVFTLGEDVPQKIREKEHRYLVRSSTESYQNAMNRKSVTEWRDLMKRVIKRGEVTKVEPTPEEPVTVEEKLPEVKEETNIADKLLASLSNVTASPAANAVPEVDNSDLADLLRGVLGVEKPEEKAYASATAAPASEIGVPDAPSDFAEDNSSYEEELRLKIEAELREKLELEAKMKAEAEADSLRRAHEELVLENERLAELARKAEEEKLAAEAEHNIETEKLRLEIEARERAEAREKERMAEAARIALAEQQRIMAERAEEERKRAAEEARRREEEAKAAEEAARAEAIRREEERIRLEMEEKARAEARAAEERAAEARRLEEERLAKLEAEKAARLEVERLERLEAEKAAKKSVTYVSKVAKLIFRYNVDPNVTKRIQEIILTTIKYFHKEDVYIKIRATVPDNTTVHLYFDKIPADENELLVNIIKVLGKSDLGITKVYLE